MCDDQARSKRAGNKRATIRPTFIPAWAAGLGRMGRNVWSACVRKARGAIKQGGSWVHTGVSLLRSSVVVGWNVWVAAVLLPWRVVKWAAVVWK